MRIKVALVAVVVAAAAGGVYVARTRGAASPVVERPPQVVRVSDDHWQVPRSLREEYFADAQRLNREFRLRPEAEPGTDRIRSLDVDLVAEGSPLHAAGFRKGDRILAVNGAPVDTMSRALGLANEARRADALTVRVERAGKVREFRCDFR